MIHEIFTKKIKERLGEIFYFAALILLCFHFGSCFAEEEKLYISPIFLDTDFAAAKSEIDFNLELDDGVIQDVSRYSMLDYHLNIEDNKNYDKGFEAAIILEETGRIPQLPPRNDQKFEFEYNF